MKLRCCFLIALVATLLGIFQSFAHSDILLPKVFCDHMVLQRNSQVPIFGTANPDQKLTITFQDQEIAVTANVKGDWSAQLATGAAGGPYEITIVATDEDAKIVISDILVGDVWLCSGQSNMSRPVSTALNAEAEIEHSGSYTNLRLFRVEESVAASPEREFAKVEPWQICSPESVKDFSATGYFFGRELVNRVENVPIGLISSAVSGTPCEAWLSRDKMDSIDSLKPLLDHWDQSDEVNSTHRPANLFNGMIAPLRKFPIRGVIWYQGEANVGRAAQYKQLFPVMIEDWRQMFGQAELPFYFAQLAPFRYQSLGPESLPELWEAQLQTLKAVPQTGMAVLTDVGNLEDIHPENKQEAGRRLALLALGKNYVAELESNSESESKSEPESESERETESELPETAVDYSGPIFDAVSVVDKKFQIKFSACRSGLKISKDSETLNGFTICGEDKKFVPAMATIDGDTVHVHSADVPNPQAVRYGWDIEAPMTLINGAGLPASPFRTDDFPVATPNADF